MAVELFFSYAHRDEALREELSRHLALLQRQGYVSAWHDRRLQPGDDWAGEIDAHLEQAQVILLLVSPDFLASRYCWDVEMRRALERHEQGEAVVVPILLRPVDWAEAPFAKLQVLPAEAKPVTTWANRDEAFADVARALRQLVTRRFLDAPPAPQGEPARPPAPARREQERVLDAALARRVVVGHSTELLAFVRRTGSAGLAAFLALEEEQVTPEDVRSRAFPLEFPTDAAGALSAVTLSIAVVSPEFQPQSQRKAIRVPPDGDSAICRFLLVPTCAGALTVSVELSVGELHQTARALRTVAEAGDRQVIVGGMGIVTIPLVTAAAAPGLEALGPPPRAPGAAAPRPAPHPHRIDRRRPPPAPAPSAPAPMAPVPMAPAPPERFPTPEPPAPEAPLPAPAGLPSQARGAPRGRLVAIAGGLAAAAAVLVLVTQGGNVGGGAPDVAIASHALALGRAEGELSRGDYAAAARTLDGPIAALESVDDRKQLDARGRDELKRALTLSARAYQGAGDPEMAARSVDRLLRLDPAFRADQPGADPRLLELVERRRERVKRRPGG
jgi:hypothetical protein